MQTSEPICDSKTIHRVPPVNLDPRDGHLFASASCYELPDARVQVLNDVELHGRGRIRHQNQYLSEGFAAPQHFESWLKQRSHWRAGFENLVSPVRRFDRPAIWITDNWSCGYFHWMCDALPRLELALEVFPAGELTLMLPNKFHRAKYFLESLKAFGLREIQILNRFERIECKELVFPSHLAMTGNHRPETLAKMRSRFQEECGVKRVRQNNRIYISRRLANRRRIANEDAILPILKRHGFETLVAEELSWGEQVETCASAQLMVSNHGAGLTNMMMMSPGAKVLEIRNTSNQDLNCYFTLADALNHPYFYLLASKVNPEKPSHWADVVVDPKELDQTLSRIPETLAHSTDAA